MAQINDICSHPDNLRHIVIIKCALLKIASIIKKWRTKKNLLFFDFLWTFEIYGVGNAVEIYVRKTKAAILKIVINMNIIINF